MEKEEVKTIALLTSGGDAPGMNAAIRAIVRTAAHNGIRAMGVRRGFSGLMDDDLFEMHSADVSDIIGRGGTILYTARCEEMMTEAGLNKAVKTLKKREIDALVVIGGDGSFRGAYALSQKGVNVIGVPATIDRDMPCSRYTIGFDTAVNTAMEAIDKVRDTSSSHMRCSIIEVMGRTSGYIALWCGIANGAEDVLIPEKWDGDVEKLAEHILTLKENGKSHFIIINAEGIGKSDKLAQKIEELTGVESRTTVLGYMQRGGAPSAKDRYYGSLMGSEAVMQLIYGKKNRIISSDGGGEIHNIEIGEALRMHSEISEDLWNICLQLRR